MKTPKYMKISKPRLSDGQLIVDVRIKKWGIPIILFKAMRDMKEYGIKRWLVYPSVCVKWIGGAYND
jgi:hypothetical protein